MKVLMTTLLLVVSLLVLTGCPGSTGPGSETKSDTATLTEKIAAASGSIDFKGARISENASVNSAVTINNLKIGGKTLTINASGVVLEAVSEARIVIGEGVGDGDVTIKNCENISSLEVKGGGANSIHLSGSKLDVVQIKKDGVRVVMNETKVNEKVTVEASQTKLEMKDTNTNAESSSKIPVLEITAHVDSVNIDSGKIDKISVASDETADEDGNGEKAAPAVTLTGKNEISSVEGKELHMVLKEEAEIVSKMSVSTENLNLEMEDTTSKIENLEVDSDVKNVNISGGQIDSISVKDTGASSEAPAINIMENVEIKEVTGTNTINVAEDVTNFEKPKGISTVKAITIDDIKLEYKSIRKEYLLDEQFSYYGLYAKIIYSNGATKRRQLTAENCTLDGFDSSTVGKSVVTVTFQNRQIGSLNIEIKDGVIEVEADQVLRIIQNLSVSCEIKVTGTVTNELFSEIMHTTSNLSFSISLDFTDTTGLSCIDWITSRLSRLVIPASVTEISEGALCNPVNEIKLAEGNTAYKMIDDAIYTKDGKTLIYYPQRKNAESFSVPEGTVRIGDQVFWNNNFLKKLNIPVSVEEIGSDILASVPLEEITVAPGNTSFKVENGVLLTMDGKRLVLYPPEKKDASYNVPSSVEMIEVSAFSAARNLSSVTIPSNVMKIGNNAFCHTGLTSISFDVTEGWYCSGLGLVSQEELTDVSNYKEYDKGFGNKLLYRRQDISVSSADIVETVKNLKESSNIKVTGTVTNELFSEVMNAANSLDWSLQFALDLSETTGLTKISWLSSRISDFTIPASVTEISEGAFSGVSEIKLATGNSNYDLVDGVLYTKDKKMLVCFPNGKRDSSFSIPNTVVRVGNNAFVSDRLENLNISASVKEIGTSAFSLYSLSQITVDSSNTSFKGVDGILYTSDGKTLIRYPAKKEGSSFNIPGTVEIIAANAFNNVKSLSSLKVPANVTKIQEYAFYYSGLTSIVFDEVDDWFYYKNGSEILIDPDDLSLASNYTSWNSLFYGVELFRKTE